MRSAAAVDCQRACIGIVLGEDGVAIEQPSLAVGGQPRPRNRSLDERTAKKASMWFNKNAVLGMSNNSHGMQTRTTVTSTYLQKAKLSVTDEATLHSPELGLSNRFRRFRVAAQMLLARSFSYNLAQLL